MKGIGLFKMMPECALKNRLRCLFYNRRLRRHGMRIRYRGGRFAVDYQGIRVEYLWNPYYKGLATLAGYFQNRGVQPGDVVVDAGACEGDFTVIAARLAGPSGRVIAFEPEPQNADRLEANLRANGITNTIVVRKGLWSQEARLAFRTGSGQTSQIDINETPESPESLPVVRLDGALKSLGVSQVDFLKADVEGAEIEMLHGASGTLSRSRASVAIASYHMVAGKQTCHEVEDILRKMGYTVETGFAEHTTTYGSR